MNELMSSGSKTFLDFRKLSYSFPSDCRKALTTKDPFHICLINFTSYMFFSLFMWNV